MADFTLQGTKIPICQTNLSSTGLVPAGSTDLRCSEGTDEYFLTLKILSPAFFSVGTTDAAKKNLLNSISYFRILEVVAEGHGAQVVLFSILTVRVK